jgi:hypothetical protein
MSTKTVIITASFPENPTATLENLVFVNNKKIQTYNVSFSNSLSGVGTYYNEYEQFATTGRRENNPDFVNSGGYSALNFQIDLNTSSSVYASPRRAKIKNVFVTKFSAPGGVNDALTDIESGEYSPYTTVPYRNLEAREALEALYSNYSTADGYDGVFGSPTASFHKVNRNPRFVLKNSTTSSVYSNGNYVASLPFYNESVRWFKDRKPQFSNGANSFVEWLTLSASNTNSEIDKSIDFNINIFVDASGTYKNPADTLHASQGLLSDYQKPFMSDLSLFSADRKTNTYKVIERKKTVDRKSATNADIVIKSYIEPVIDSTNYSLVFDYVESDGSDSKIKFNFADISFANKELDNAYNVQDSFSENIEASLKDLNILNYKKVTLNQTVFPSNKITSLDSSRKRSLFTFPEWASNLENRKIDNLTSSYFSESYSEDFTYGGQNVFTTGSIWHIDYATGSDNSRGELQFSSKYPALYHYQISTTPFYMADTPYAFSGNRGPFFNKEEDFSEDIKTKYFNYSTVPEYTSQNVINQIDVFEQSLYSDINNEYYVTGTNNLLTDYTYNISNIKNKKIDKVNFKFNIVNKFRPYKNLYPVQKTLEIANLLSSSFVHFSGNSPYALFRHVTSPGLLYNAIKSGIPLTFPKLAERIELVNGIDNQGSQLSGSFKFEEIYNINAAIKNILLHDVVNVGEGELTASYTGSSDNMKYTSCVTNFIQETQKFFMKNEDLSYFESKSEEEFAVLETGYTYSLGFRIDDAFSQSIKLPTEAGSYRFSSGYSSIGSFGPWDTTIVGKPPYTLIYLNVPFIPPYYKRYIVPGMTNAQVLITPTTYSEIHFHFIPKETRKYRLDEIFSGSTIEYMSSSVFDVCTGALNPDSIPPFGIEQKYQKLDEIFKFKNTVENVESGVSVKKWNIGGKCEFPFFDFKHIEKNKNPIYLLANGNELTQVGLWHQYGNIPKETEGLSISIFDLTDGLIYAGKKFGSVNQANRSLIDACGFDRKITSKNICRLKEKIDIKELVVLIPFNFESKKSFAINSDSKLAKRNRKFMEQYVFPPQFDQVYGTSKQNIFMICSESIATLNKQDLSDIWQNFMPSLSFNHEEYSSNFELPAEDVDNLDEIISSDTKWIIFKVKQRASTNRDKSTPIQYNWPYDNFSLIELAKVETQIVYDNKEPEIRSKIIQRQEEDKTSTKNYLDSNRKIINTEKEIDTKTQTLVSRQSRQESAAQTQQPTQGRSSLQKLLSSETEAPSSRKQLSKLSNIERGNKTTGRETK